MPWIQVNEQAQQQIWLRTESIIGLAAPERSGRGTRLLLLSGTDLDVTEDRESLLQKIKELEGTAARERRVGFPGD
jgi:hypothetical protein